MREAFTWDYGHPNKGIITLLASRVSSTRPSKILPVGTGKHNFTTMKVAKGIYGVGWDGAILLMGSTSGVWTIGEANSAIESNTPNPNLISLNHDSKEQLMSLPKIGPAKADTIIAFRNNNAFTSIEQLDQVDGIGPAIVNQLRPLVSL